ncbi:unnamed protein product [Prorocentrum cordatum]|uniref:Uncharacterized protein n=1 Tax=Prorocentrum cordatum TaxID=2364126 RepID=A0ABN9VKY6_9DINO|nr:unnamed protein product [Polarella glacialis]
MITGSTPRVVAGHMRPTTLHHRTPQEIKVSANPHPRYSPPVRRGGYIQKKVRSMPATCRPSQARMVDERIRGPARAPPQGRRGSSFPLPVRGIQPWHNCVAADLASSAARCFCSRPRSPQKASPCTPSRADGGGRGGPPAPPRRDGAPRGLAKAVVTRSQPVAAGAAAPAARRVGPSPQGDRRAHCSELAKEVLRWISLGAGGTSRPSARRGGEDSTGGGGFWTFPRAKKRRHHRQPGPPRSPGSPGREGGPGWRWGWVVPSSGERELGRCISGTSGTSGSECASKAVATGVREVVPLMPPLRRGDEKKEAAPGVLVDRSETSATCPLAERGNGGDEVTSTSLLAPPPPLPSPRPFPMGRQRGGSSRR